MPKSKPKDKTYTAATASDVVKQCQVLVNGKPGFPWATIVDQKEMRFIYDLVSSADTMRNFQPTPAQAQWGIRILKKIEAFRKTYREAAGKKAPSQKSDAAARRHAKAYLKHRGIVFDKTSPSDLDLAQKMHEIGLLTNAPTKDNAKDALIRWNAGRTAPSTTPVSPQKD